MQIPITNKIQKFDDDRGWFMSTYTDGLPVKNWVMQNTSYSSKNTIRGLHYQSPHAQTKLITVLEGAITDVTLDIDPQSPTYGQWLLFHLSSSDSALPNQIYVPNHYAHGFAVTSETALISYLTDDIYHPEAEHSINPLCPTLNIPWSIQEPIISEKDSTAPSWTTLESNNQP